MNNKIIVFFGIIVLFIICMFTSLFKINQGNEGVILRLGELNKYKNGEIKIYKPGLNFKFPIIEEVKFYDMRLRTLTFDSSRVVTSEQKDVIIDAYLEWKIDNISQFYRSVSGNDLRAEILLKQFLESSLRAEVGKNNIQGLLHNERDDLMMRLTKHVQSQAIKIGINVIDVRIKQIELPSTVNDSIYQRMRSERQKVASFIRAQGEQLSEEIKANADSNALIIIAKADLKSKEMKAKAEAIAAKIYIKAYSKSKVFYEFWRNIKAYQSIFKNKEDAIFILKPQGKFFKYMNFDNN